MTLLTLEDKIARHPSVTHQAEIADICRPLKKLGITYFAHVNVHQNAFSALTNHPEFHSHYLSKHYYNADIHLANSEFINDHFLWTLVENDGETNQMNQDAIDHGIMHTFTIIEKSKEGDNFYHFGINTNNSAINHVYFTKMDMLKLFIMHFNHSVMSAKNLAAAYQFKFGIDNAAPGFLVKNNFHVEIGEDIEEDFLRELNINNKTSRHSENSLTTRQLSILYWMHQGKTINDIAKILGIAEITVNKHISDIKSRLGCYTHFQLGELFSKQFDQSLSTIQLLAEKTIQR